MTDEAWLSRAVELALENAERGARPFGAVIVRDGELVATGVNRALEEADPTAHAELLALREAGRVLGTISLAGCVVYASGEPCPMCQAASALAGVERIVYAATSALAAGSGLGRPQPVPLEHLPVAGAERPFEVFASRTRSRS